MQNKQKAIFMIAILIISMLISPLATTVHADDETPINDIFVNGKICRPEAPVIILNDDGSNNEFKCYVITPDDFFKLNDYLPFSIEHIGINGPCYWGYQIDYKTDENNWKYVKAWDKLDMSNVENSNINHLITMNNDETVDFLTKRTIVLLNEESTRNGIEDITIQNGNNPKFATDGKNLSFRVRAYFSGFDNNGNEKYYFSDWSKETRITKSSSITNNGNAEILIQELKATQLSGSVAVTINLESNPEIMREIIFAKELNDENNKIEIEVLLIQKDENGEFKIENGIKPDSSEHNNQMHKPIFCNFIGTELTRYSDWGVTVRVIDSNGEYKSNYAEVVTLTEMGVDDPNVDEENNVVIEDEVEILDSCSVCGSCSQPLGMCIYLLIAIGAIATIVIVIVVFVKKRQKEGF